jgi:hypothetical protein
MKRPQGEEEKRQGNEKDRFLYRGEFAIGDI